MRRDRILDAARFERAARLPPNAACEVCGAADVLVLDDDAATVLCADHAALRDGRSATEQHHLGKRGWPIVLDLTPNWHRIVTALQRMRKGGTKGSVAELLYGIADLIYAVADYVNRKETKDSPKHARSAAR